LGSSGCRELSVRVWSFAPRLALMDQRTVAETRGSHGSRPGQRWMRKLASAREHDLWASGGGRGGAQGTREMRSAGILSCRCTAPASRAWPWRCRALFCLLCAGQHVIPCILTLHTLRSTLHALLPACCPWPAPPSFCAPLMLEIAGACVARAKRADLEIRNTCRTPILRPYALFHAWLRRSALVGKARPRAQPSVAPTQSTPWRV
jgi:hypothetical protein